ncbi:MAG: creatininase family protein [Anaerolinea sp.]|nr:creatininase family protein [Anaerolinea sp.]
MLLQDMNWMDVERYLEQDNRIILVTGATEQHAYLSLFTDILIPSRLAFAAAERENVIIAPPFPYGVSELFMEFPGTISISQPTFDALLNDAVDSLMLQGFTRFFVLNGHGGNKFPARLNELHMEGLARITWYDWWRSPASKAFQAEYGLQLDHANWGENFHFNRIVESPTEPKPPVNLDLITEGQPVRDVLGDGSYGGDYQIADDLMHLLFERVVDEAAALIAALRE